MKRRQLKLLLWIFIALIGAAGMVYVTGRALLLRRALVLRSEGLAAAHAGDDARAIDILTTYIQRRPRDTDTIKTFLECRRRVPMTNGQQYADTIAIVKLLLQQQPSLIDDKRYLLELYVALERGPEAIDTADDILKTLPNDTKTLQLKTQALIQQHRFQEALQMANRLAAANPLDLPAQITRLTLCFQLEQPPQTVINDAQALAQSHPGDARFQVLQAFAYGRAGKITQNVQWVQQAVQWLQTAAKHPDLDDAIAQIIAEQFDFLGDNNDALAVLQDRAAHGAGPDLRHLLARRLWERSQWTASADALSDINPSDLKADTTLLALKGIALAQLGRTEGAAACLKTLSAETHPDARAWAALLGRAVDHKPSDYKQLSELCRAGSAFDPQNPYLDYFFADSEIHLGELDLAITALGHAVALDNHWNVPAVRLTQCLLAAGQPQQAMSVAFILAARKPIDAATAVTVAQAWAVGVENGQAGQADKLLDFVSKVQSQWPGENEILPMIKVQVLAQQGQKDAAIAAAREAMTRTPPPPEAVFRLVTALSRRYGLGLESESFAAWERAAGDTPSLAFQEAISQFSAGRPQDGLQTFDRLASKSGKSADSDWQLARTQYLDAIGDLGAKAAWTALCNAFPNELKVQQAAIDARAVRGDWKFMLPVIDRLHALTGDHAVGWQLARLNLMITAPRSEDDYEKGAVDLNALIEHYPQLAQPHLLLAQALVHMKRIDGAIDHLTDATKLDPASVPAALQLVTLLQSQGDSQKAAKELDRVTRLPLTDQQRQDVAMLLTEQGNSARAINVLQQPSPAAAESASPDQNDNRDLLLAILYRKQHQNQKAETIIRGLLPRPNVTLIQVAASLFTADGHPDDAQQALSLLDGLNLQPGAKEVILGDFYDKQLHNLSEAARHFTAATKQAPANIYAWQSLAVCLMAQGHPADALACATDGAHANPSDPNLAIIHQNSQLLIAAGSDERLRPLAVSVLADPHNSGVPLELITAVSEGHRSNNLEDLAVRLKQIDDRNPDNVAAQLQLTQCYLDMGRMSDAMTTAQRAMAVFPNDPETARAAMVAASLAGRWPEMESAAQNWKARDPGIAEAADTAAAESENHRFNFAAALADVRPYLPAVSADPEHHASLLWAYVVASAGSGDLSGASDILWPLALKSPLGRQQWIELAVNDLPPPQAKDWLTRIEAIIPRDSLAERCDLASAYAALGRRAHDDQLVHQSADKFNQLTSDPNATAQVFVAAGSEAESDNRLPDAETDYRRALTLDPTLWVAQNNLAMVIINRGGDAREAEQLALASIKAQPHRADLYDTLAEVRSKAGDLKGAAEAIAVAVKLQPNNFTWRVRLAKYFLQSGNLNQASQAVTAIDADFPDLRSQDQDLQKQLADIRKQIHG